MTISSTESAGPVLASRGETRWRTRDIVVAAVLGVAFGVVFWAWGLAWSVFEPLNAVFPVARDLLYAVWLVPAVLAPLVVRKPGAALFAEMVAAGVSALLGSAWGVDTLLSGFVQGAAAELVFAFTLYRLWSFPVIAVAAIASAAAAWIHDWVLYYPEVAVDLQIARGIAMAVSAVVIVAAGSIALVRSLRRAGVLEGFPG
ncbi:MAG TPA: ECF transporter S component [Candidatus Sulfomarinibacteraceae bacterium]|nr:ECF transporter S component [Candidatus Sulfomarinibacteraceae bacterium]